MSVGMGGWKAMSNEDEATHNTTQQKCENRERNAVFFSKFKIIPFCQLARTNSTLIEQQ